MPNLDQVDYQEEFIQRASAKIADGINYELSLGRRSMLDRYEKDKEKFVEAYMQFIDKDLQRSIDYDIRRQNFVENDISFNPESPYKGYDNIAERVGWRIREGGNFDLNDADAMLHYHFDQNKENTVDNEIEMAFVNEDGNPTQWKAKYRLDREYEGVAKGGEFHFERNGRPTEAAIDDGSFAIVDINSTRKAPLDPKQALAQMDQIIICQDYASAVSLSAASGQPVILGATLHNTSEVAYNLSERYPDKPMTLCTAGERMLSGTAKGIGCNCLVPQFSITEKEKGCKTIYDKHNSRGLDSVKSDLGITKAANKQMER